MNYRNLNNMDENELIDYGNVLSAELSKDYIWNNEKLWRVYFEELRRIHNALGGY